MKKLFATLAIALSLTGCAPLLSALTSTPASYANQTVLDEKGAITVELAYKAARLAVETGVEAGLIKGQRALAVADLDTRAFTAVVGVRAAYRAGNAQSYAVAIVEANAAVADLIASAKGN